MGVVQGNTGVGAVLSVSVSGGSGRTVHRVHGVRVGDRITLCRDATNFPATDSAIYFEPWVTADDCVVQTSGDLSNHSIAIVLTRPT